MKKDKTVYTAEDIRCISFERQVLENPLMYWGNSTPDTGDAINAVLELIRILGFESEIVEKFQDWTIVGSGQDWISSGLNLGKTVRELFEKGVGFPEKGGNSMRCEFFIYTFSENICLWRDNQLHVLKSNINNDLKVELVEKHQNSCLVAFRGNRYKRN